METSLPASEFLLFIILGVFCETQSVKAAQVTTHAAGLTSLPEPWFSLQYVQDSKQCPQSSWYHFIHGQSKKKCHCFSDYLTSHIVCSEDGETHLEFGFCATYSDNSISVSQCLIFFQPIGYNITKAGYILLPKSVSELNDYMCGPLNRKGNVCSECRMVLDLQ